MSWRCAEIELSIVHRSKSMMLTVLSSDAVANLRSVGEKAMSRTAEVWGVIVRTQFNEGSQYLTTPELSPETSHVPVWDHCMARTAESWQSVVTRKLKLDALHSAICPD